jgi:hypothetical protein
VKKRVKCPFARKKSPQNRHKKWHKLPQFFLNKERFFGGADVRGINQGRKTAIFIPPHALNYPLLHPHFHIKTEHFFVTNTICHKNCNNPSSQQHKSLTTKHLPPPNNPPCNQKTAKHRQNGAQKCDFFGFLGRLSSHPQHSIGQIRLFIHIFHTLTSFHPYFFPKTDRFFAYFLNFA